MSRMRPRARVAELVTHQSGSYVDLQRRRSAETTPRDAATSTPQQPVRGANGMKSDRCRRGPQREKEGEREPNQEHVHEQVEHHHVVQETAAAVGHAGWA